MSEFQRPQRMWPDLHLPELPRSRGAAQVFPSLQASRPPEGHLPSPLPSPQCSPGPSGSLQPMVPPSNTPTSPAPQPRASVRPPAFPLVPRGVSGAGHRGGRGRGWIPVPAPGPGPPGLCGGPDPPSLLQEGGRAEGPAREVCTGVCARGALCIHMCAYMCIWAHMDVHMGTHGCAHSCDVECRNTSIQACALGRKLLWLQSFLKWKHPQRRPLSLPGAFPPRGKFGWASTPWPECPQLSVWLGLRGQEGDSQPGWPPAGREALWGRWCLQWGGALGVLQNPGDPAVGRD